MSDFVVPRSTRRLFAVLLIYALALAAVAWPLDAPSYRAIFDDDAFFLRLAPIFWLGLALACAVQAVPLADGRGRGRNLFVLALIAALLAMREADWLHRLGSIGHLRWVALAFVLAVTIKGLWLGLRTLRRRASWREAWVWTLASGVLVALALEAMHLWIGLAVDTYGVALPEQTQHLFVAWQEGFACAVPLIFGLALWQWRRSIVAATPLDAEPPQIAALR